MTRVDVRSSDAKQTFLNLVTKKDRPAVGRWLSACGRQGTSLALGALKSHAHPDVAGLMLGRRDAARLLLKCTRMAEKAAHDRELEPCFCGAGAVARNVDGDTLCRRHLAPLDLVTARVS